MPSRRSILSLTLLVGSQLLAPGNAAAQNAPATDQTAAPAETATAPKAKMGEEIVVTGSRIRRKDLTTPAPVTVISRDEIIASGKLTLGDFLQSLPEQGNATNTQVNNGGDGSTRVNLRGLGDQRTLVLVNGRRMVGHAFSSMVADPSPDLNSIPASAIERIEVLKDGASAVYGSDAIAGVVNIITRKKYDGSEASAMSGLTTHGDGNVYDVSVTTGTSSDRGNLMFSAGYYNQGSIMSTARDWSNVPRRYTFSKDATTGAVTGKPGTYGSTFSPNSKFVPPQDPSTGAPNPALNTPLYNQAMGPDIGGYATFDQATGALRAVGANDSFNFQPYNYLSTPQQRISLFSTGDYKLADNVRAYYEASFVNTQSQLYQAPEPYYLSLKGNTVSAQNQYNPFGVTFDPNDPAYPADIYRRMMEVGPRINNINDNTFRIVLGLDGTLPDAFGPLAGWFWDAGVNYGRSTLSEDDHNYLNIPRMEQALGPSSGGACLDRVTGREIAGCVPLNLFGGPGSISPAMADWIRARLANNSWLEQTQAYLNTSGSLFSLFADRPVGLALGYEFRRQNAIFVPDALTAANQSSTNQALPTSGAFNANEGYAELSIPVVNHLPFAEEIELTAAGRVFNYSTFGTDWTYKFGARWAVVPDFTMRGTYSTAYRAPSVQDLYGGAGDSWLYLSDPCSGPNAPATCGNARGITQDPNKQVRTTVGGNAALQPETAKIFTAGVVVQPRWVKNLTLTADYYNVRVWQAISTYGSQYILDQCYSGNANFCGLVSRGANQQLANVVDVNQNIGSQKTDGIDFAARYVLPTEVGRFGFMFDGTWLNKFDIYQPDGTVIHAKGTFDGAGPTGFGGVYPDFKFNTGVTYALGGLGAGVNMRFIGSYSECASPDSARLQGSGSYCYLGEEFKRSVDAYEIFDLFLSYSLKSSYGKTTISAGVNNLFDVTPPFVYGGFQNASDPYNYDYIGRFVYLRLTQAI